MEKNDQITDFEGTCGMMDDRKDDTSKATTNQEPSKDSPFNTLT